MGVVGGVWGGGDGGVVGGVVVFVWLGFVGVGRFGFLREV